MVLTATAWAHGGRPTDILVIGPVLAILSALSLAGGFYWRSRSPQLPEAGPDSPHS